MVEPTSARQPTHALRLQELARAVGRVVTRVQTLEAAPSGGGGGSSAWGGITGTLANQTDLQAALNAKQAVGSYSVTGHAHVVADVTGLQAQLDGKQAVGSYAASVHSHIIGDVTGLQAALDGKQVAGSYAAASHTHAQADITGLVAALAAKEPSITAGTIAQYWRGDKSFQTLDKIAVGLANVDNTTDAAKPVSTAQATAIGLKLDATHAGTGGTSHATVVAAGAAGFMTGADKTKLDAITGTNTGDQTSVSGNAGSATVLQTARTIAVTGDLAYTSPAFNGSANVTAAGTLATVNTNIGTFGSSTLVPVVTVNAKGLVTAVTTAAVSGGGGVTDGDKGDIIVTATGATWTIDADAVTNAKLANVATASIKGRVTAAIGDPEDLTGTQATTLLDVATGALKGLMSATDKAKLDGVATGATANATDASLRDRATHTGAQAISTVTGLQAAIDGKQPLATVLTNTTASFTTAQEAKLSGVAAGATANSPDATLLARDNHTGTQTAATVSDFNATARAQTEAELVAGANVTITPSGVGATRQLTIAATAGSSGTATVVAGRTYRSTNQSIPAGAGFTLVSFDTVGMAVGGTFFNPAFPTEGIIPEDGVHTIVFEGTGEGTATPVTWEIQVSVGGAVVGGSQFMAAANAVAQLDNIAARQFTAGQKVTVGVKHSNATALNLFAEGNHSPDLIIIKQGGAKGDAGPAATSGLGLMIAAGSFSN